MLLAARACGYTGGKHVDAAAIIEFIHTATLLHDDVVDSSDMRRGRDTANHVFGNEASVLVGDFLYSRAFQMMVGLDNLRIQEIMADATNTIAEGEVLQLMNAHDPDTTEERYLEVIYRKTAKLFEAGAQVAAVLSGAPAAVEQAVIDYGRHLGTAFQLVDDVARLQLGRRGARQERRRRPRRGQADAAADLRDGPLVGGRHGATRAAVEHGGLEELETVTRTIESSGGLEYTARLARREADLAIDALGRLPESTFSRALRELADFAVGRSY